MYGKMNRELGRYPETPVVKTGRPDNGKRGRPMVFQGFGFIHSTRRTGKPATWGRDGQKYAACKGNQLRTCWIGKMLANLPAGNSKEGNRSLSKFYEHVKRILYKWLNRRSQRRSFKLVEFDACWERYGVPKPRIVESDLVQLHFDF